MKSTYRKEIDGLRAVAIISVILNHFNKETLPGGYLGVDIFFVISGYVITCSLSEQTSSGFREFLLNFYVRRVKRLIPALSTFVLITSVLISLFDPSPEVSLATGLSSLLGLSNLYLLKNSTDYFAAPIRLNVFMHTWSLGLEEQFYVFFPFLIWLLAVKRNGLRDFSITVGALSLISFVAFFYFNADDSNLSFYIMPTRFWELAIGALTFAFIKCNRLQYQSHLSQPMSIIATLLICAALLLPERFNTMATALIVFSSAFLLVFAQPRTIVHTILASRPFVYLGLISYSLYLWHWGVISISLWTIGIHLWTLPFQIVTMVLLAMVSYHHIENPLRRSTWSDSHLKTLALAISGLMLVAGLLFLLIKPFYGRLYTGSSINLIASGSRSLTENYSIPGTNTVWNGPECVLRSNDEVGKKILIEKCTLGVFRSARKRVLVIGNSFSASFTHAFDKLVTEDDYSITITSSWGASPTRKLDRDKRKHSAASNYYWDQVVPSLTSELREGDWVFMIFRLDGLMEKEQNQKEDFRLKTLKEGIEEFSTFLKNRGIKLAVMDGIPLMEQANCTPSVAAKQWFNLYTSSPQCNLLSKEETLSRRAKLHNLLSGLDHEDKITLIDVFDIFCPEKICGFQLKDGTFMYRDAVHPSVEAAELSLLQTRFRELLKPELN